MKGWKLALAVIGGVVLGGGIMFLWFMFQMVDALLN